MMKKIQKDAPTAKPYSMMNSIRSGITRRIAIILESALKGLFINYS